MASAVMVLGLVVEGNDIFCFVPWVRKSSAFPGFFCSPQKAEGLDAQQQDDEKQRPMCVVR